MSHHRIPGFHRPGTRVAAALYVLLTFVVVTAAGELEFVRKSDGAQFKHTIEGRQIVVRFHPEVTEERRGRVVTGLGLTPVHDSRNAKQIAVYAVPQGQTAEATAELVQSLPEVLGARPALTAADGSPWYYVPGELTVYFGPDLSPDAAEALITGVGSSLVERHRTPGYYTVSTPPGQTVFEAIRTFDKLDAVVASGGSVMIFNLFDGGPPPPTDDPLYPGQWQHDNTGQTTPPGTPDADIDTPGAWAISRGDPDVVLVVIDSGLDMDHPDLVDNILPRGNQDWDFTSGPGQDPEGGAHGTAVAGLAAAAGNNGIGVAGVCPDCSILPLKIAYNSGCQPFVDALTYVQTRAVSDPGRRYIVNGSFHANSCEQDPMFNSLLYTLAYYGVPLLFAAGNDDYPVPYCDLPIKYPASSPHTLAIGASSPCDGLKHACGGSASCDNEGWNARFTDDAGNVAIAVAAPGVDTLTTCPVGSYLCATDSYREFDGTSAATPITAGVVGLMLSVRGNLTYGPDGSPNAIKDALVNNAELKGSMTGGSYEIWRRLNAEAAVDAVQCQTDADCEDGEPCSGADSCVNGTCVFGPLCFDGLDCNGQEQCSGGICTGRVPLTCGAGEVCAENVDPHCQTSCQTRTCGPYCKANKLTCTSAKISGSQCYDPTVDDLVVCDERTTTAIISCDCIPLFPGAICPNQATTPTCL